MEGHGREGLDGADAPVGRASGGGSPAAEINCNTDEGPLLGDLHWKESAGLGRESRVLYEDAMGMLEATMTARRPRESGWCEEKGQGRWQAKKLLEWAAKELIVSRRDLELQFGDIQDRAQRAAMERRMGDSLLKWLWLDKPPNQRVRHKVWREQLIDSTRQLRLGADRARQRTELEMLDGTEVYSVVDGAGAESMAGVSAAGNKNSGEWLSE